MWVGLGQSLGSRGVGVHGGVGRFAPTGGCRFIFFCKIFEVFSSPSSAQKTKSSLTDNAVIRYMNAMLDALFCFQEE